MPTVVLEPRAKKIVRHIQGAAGIGDPTNIDYLKFNTAAGEPSPSATAQMWWDSDEETANLRLPNGVVLNIGQEAHWPVRNNTGVSIPDGTVVMATGTVGASGKLTVAPMDGTDVTNARFILGIATETIANGDDGKVSTFGKVRNIDTTGQGGETWNDGDVLWVSPTTAGALTNVEPADGLIGLPVAYVVNSADNGTIAVRVTPIDEHNFTGRLYNYEERDSSVSFTAGSATVNYTTCDNILAIDSLTQNSTITFTNITSYRKPVTLSTVADTGGPWTLDIVANGKTINLTRNGAGTADQETFEFWSDGIDLLSPDSGGVVWSEGA